MKLRATTLSLLAILLIIVDGLIGFKAYQAHTRARNIKEFSSRVSNLHRDAPFATTPLLEYGFDAGCFSYEAGWVIETSCYQQFAKFYRFRGDPLVGAAKVNEWLVSKGYQPIPKGYRETDQYQELNQSLTTLPSAEAQYTFRGDLRDPSTVSLVVFQSPIRNDYWWGSATTKRVMHEVSQASIGDDEYVVGILATNNYYWSK